MKKLNWRQSINTYQSMQLKCRTINYWQLLSIIGVVTTRFALNFYSVDWSQLMTTIGQFNQSIQFSKHLVMIFRLSIFTSSGTKIYFNPVCMCVCVCVCVCVCIKLLKHLEKYFLKPFCLTTSCVGFSDASAGKDSNTVLMWN